MLQATWALSWGGLGLTALVTPSVCKCHRPMSPCTPVVAATAQACGETPAGCRAVCCRSRLQAVRAAQGMRQTAVTPVHHSSSAAVCRRVCDIVAQAVCQIRAPTCEMVPHAPGCLLFTLAADLPNGKFGGLRTLRRPSLCCSSSNLSWLSRSCNWSTVC